MTVSTTLNSPIKNALDAVTHVNPYPWYENLRKNAPVYFDPALKLWIASSSAAVAAIFENANCGVRPASEPVPAAIAGTPAGEVFSHLIRMNEGVRHDAPKLAIERALGAVDAQKLQQRTIFHTKAHSSIDAIGMSNMPQFSAVLNDAIFRLPLYVLAELMGFSQDELPKVVDWMRDFVSCLSPLSTLAELSNASEAATQLLMRFDALLASVQFSDYDSNHTTLVGQVQAQYKFFNFSDRKALLSNLVGLLSQTFEATAALIANSITTLIAHPELMTDLQANTKKFSKTINMLVEEVCRYDAPIQNTRRYVFKDTEIFGVNLKTGDVVLILLGSANRDAALNEHPDEFVIQRESRNYFSFGRGNHTCPGRRIALTIASSILCSWLSLGLSTTLQNNLNRLTWTYRLSVNARIPHFSATKTN